MPRIHPTIAPLHPAEQQVVDSLRIGPRNWHVIPAFYWVNAATGNRLRGEIDVLLLAPGVGAVVIEVKSGIHSVAADGAWYDGHSRVERTPDQQAVLSAYQLGRLLSMHGYNIPVHAFVAFTAMASSDLEKLPIDSAMAFGKDDLERFSAELEHRLGEYPSAPFDGDAARALSHVLRPGQATLLPLSHELKQIDDLLASKARRVVEFTDAQSEAMRIMNGSSSVVVKGSAGTGKTLVAIERAAQLAQSKHRVLYLLGDGELLAERLRVEFTRRGLEIDVELGPKFLQSIDARKYAGTPVERLKYAAVGREMYDAVIVDESQMLIPRGGTVLDWLASVPLVYFFGDPNQVGNGKESQVLSFLNSTHFSLNENCRNSAAISDAARTFAPWVKTAADVTGPPPLVFATDDRETRIRRVPAIVHHMTSEGLSLPDIAVLIVGDGRTVRSTSVGDTRTALEESGIDPDELSGCCTAWSFIGMEASAIILVDVGDPPMRAFRWVITSQKRELYMAITRARGMLAVVTSRKSARWLERNLQLKAVPSEELAGRLPS